MSAEEFDGLSKASAVEMLTVAAMTMTIGINHPHGIPRVHEQGSPNLGAILGKNIYVYRRTTSSQIRKKGTNTASS